MKVVLSGTDSLGFMFSQDNQLYDRCILVHTTFIPYREFEGVLGIAGIDEFIRYGGTMKVEVESLPYVGKGSTRTLIAQPGLRYAQADALVQSLLEDRTFADLSLAERTYVLERVRAEIKGRMLEDIVLLETKLAFPRKRVFVLQFAVGEFDMAVYDPDAGSCAVYEIKHSTEAVAAQSRHLRNAEKCALTEHRYGPIVEKCVLYRGEDFDAGDVRYRNVEEYLKALG